MDLDRLRAEHAAAVSERNELRALQAEQQRAFAEGLRVATKTAREDGARAMQERTLRSCEIVGAEAAAVAIGNLDPVTVVGSERHGVYVASRASIPERGSMWRRLRADGLPVTSTWIDEDGPGASNMADLWRRINGEVAGSKALILYIEPGDLPLKGAFVEVGMALAAGLRIFVAAQGVDLASVGSWVWSPGVTICADLDDAVRQVRSTVVGSGS